MELGIRLRALRFRSAQGDADRHAKCNADGKVMEYDAEGDTKSDS